MVSVTIKMNKNIKKYWKSEIELIDSSKVESLRNNEFVEKILNDFIETCSKKRGEVKAELSSAKELSESEIVFI